MTGLNFGVIILVKYQHSRYYCITLVLTGCKRQEVIHDLMFTEYTAVLLQYLALRIATVDVCCGSPKY